MRPQLHTPSLVVAALVVGSLANLAEFRAIEDAAGAWYQAVRVKVGHTLPELGDEHFASTQLRFAVYLDLRAYAYGGVIELPRDAPMIDEQLLGLSGLEELDYVTEEVQVSAEVAAVLDRNAVATGEDEFVGPFAVVAPAEGGAERILYVRGPQWTYFVTPKLLAEAGGEVPS